MTKKYLVIDGVSYPVHITKLDRKADVLDKEAYRTEDGVVHRVIIGTYMNYSVEVGTELDDELYDRLFEVLSAPVYSHKVKFPNEDKAVERYISSVKDGILRVRDDGTIYQGLKFNATCVAPTVRA